MFRLVYPIVGTTYIRNVRAATHDEFMYMNELTLELTTTDKIPIFQQKGIEARGRAVSKEGPACGILMHSRTD